MAYSQQQLIFIGTRLLGGLVYMKFASNVIHLAKLDEGGVPKAHDFHPHPGSLT